jgi:hypothetical protein
MKQNQTPDWRWRRAARLVDNDLRPSRTRDDVNVKKAWRFLTRLQRMDFKAEERLADDMPDLYEAFKIWDDNQAGIRWIFEASVMADRPVEELADYLRADAVVLRVYEVMFFDARDALKHPGCIISNVLMPMMTGSVGSRDTDVAWKAMAYFGGWDAVTSSWEMGHASPAALDFLKKAINEQIIKNAFDAVFTTPINGFNAVEHARLSLEKTRQDHELGMNTTGDSGLLAMAGLIGSIHTTVLRSDIILPAEEVRLQLPETTHIIDQKPRQGD